MDQNRVANAEQCDDRHAAFAEQLRNAGLRVTAQRLAALSWLSSHPHASADEIRTGVQGQLGSVSTQAVYGVLAACMGAGLVRRIDPAGSSGRFECRVGDNHHHVICRNCGHVEDTDCVIGERPCLTPADNHGFVVDEAEVLFWGLCPRCRTETMSDGAVSSSRGASIASGGPSETGDEDQG